MKRRLVNMILDRPRKSVEKKRPPLNKPPIPTPITAVEGALRELDDNQIGRANRCLATLGVAEDCAEVRARIAAKYPRDCALPPHGQQVPQGPPFHTPGSAHTGCARGRAGSSARGKGHL